MLQGVLLVINLIIFVCGVAVLGGGIYMQVVMNQYLDFLDDQVVSTSIVLIVIGALIALVSFLGCCGSCTGNACLMKTYGALLCILLIAEIGTAIAVYVFRNDVNDLMREGMTKTMKNYGKDEFVAPTESWDKIQTTIQCCGIDDYKSWKNAAKLSVTSSVPDSCCIKEEPGCGTGYASKPEGEAKEVIYTKGCLSTVETNIKDNVGIAAGIGVGIAVIQLITIISAFCLGKKNDYEFA